VRVYVGRRFLTHKGRVGVWNDWDILPFVKLEVSPVCCRIEFSIYWLLWGVMLGVGWVRK
jgi:hypothetical protein